MQTQPQPQPSIESLLLNKDMRVDFIFFVNKIHAQESLLFWMEVEIFKRIKDADECAKQAKLLYFRYLHPNSNSEVNVEGRLKAEVEDVIARGVWDVTLFNTIQESVHECLKYSVVKSFLDYKAKTKIPIDADPKLTPTHFVLERYEDVLHRSDPRESRINPLRSFLQRHKKYESIKKEKPPKTEKISLLKGSSTLRGMKSPKKERVLVSSEAHNNGILVTPAIQRVTDEARDLRRTRRLSQQELQQQIQLLRNLHQYQQTTKGAREEENTWEDLSNTTLSSSPLNKSLSTPVIGLSAQPTLHSPPTP